MNTWKNKGLALASSNDCARLNAATARKSVSRCSLAAALSMALFTIPALGAEASPSNPQQIWPVQTCDDVTGPGSLRYIATHAQSGDTIDFSQLPMQMQCGIDSTITLSAGEVVFHQANITLKGPLPGAGSVTLSGGGASRVIRQQGYDSTGTLTVQNLRIVDGYVHEVGYADGACIESDARIFLQGSAIADCAAISDTDSAAGGAIWTDSIATGPTLTLQSSIVSGSTASTTAIGKSVRGGAIHAQNVEAKYSRVENNHSSGPAGIGAGGAIWSRSIDVSYSTFSDNSTEGSGGAFYLSLAANTAGTIRNSTLSGNHSHYSGGAAFIAGSGALEIYNSTIANNSSETANGGGLYVVASPTEIESTIVANNTSVPMSDGADLYVKNGMPTGTSNAIMSSNVHPAGFIAVSQDPMLAPLSWIGGLTKTHSLRAGSPVIGLGSNVANLLREQRGAGFSRTTGPMTTVDIGAVQFDDRIFASDLDGFFL